MTFESLGLKPELLSAVRDQGYDTPTPVQAQAIPVVLQGRDLIAGAQTGTGKTAAFTLPLLQLLSQSGQVGGKPRVRALILTPTRELAMQVEESVRTYGKHLNLRSATIFGGVNINPQIRALRNGVDILVATPGRLLDHYQQGTLDFRALEILVLDEADRMLDMGFIRDIRKILSFLPAKRQNLLFSATFNEEIRGLASGILHNPESVDVAQRNTTTELVKHVIHPVDREKKRLLLVHLIQTRAMYQALVFTRTKHGANHLATHLLRSGITCAAIHGDKSQAQRVRALSDFKAGKIQILVATDIAARGLDIDQLPHVINFELPQVAEDYVHRIGRTGRAGSEGEALSLVCLDELGLLRDIERLLKRSLVQEVIPGWEPDPNAPIEPIQKPRTGRFGQQSRNDRGNRPSEPVRHDRQNRPASTDRHDRGQQPARSVAAVPDRGARNVAPPRPASNDVAHHDRPARQASAGRRPSSPEISRTVKNLVDQTVGGFRLSRKDITPIR